MMRLPLSVLLVAFHAPHASFSWVPHRVIQNSVVPILFYRNRVLHGGRSRPIPLLFPTQSLSVATLPSRADGESPKKNFQAQVRSVHRVRVKEQARPLSSQHREISNGINQSMMRNLALSQVTLLSLMTAVALIATTLFGESFLQSLTWVQTSSLFEGGDTLCGRILLGALATTPMIGLSLVIDQTKSHKAANHVHFATSNMVISLFGRRHQPKAQQQTRRQPDLVGPTTLGFARRTENTTSTLQVILSSIGLTTLTGVTEEIIFRGYIPTLIFALTQSPIVAWLAQGLAFGLGHIHPSAQKGENQVVAAVQTMNALFIYGLVYAFTGGDLWPCIIAHFLYDMHVLLSSWHRVNRQIDWTESQEERMLSEDRAALWQLQEWAGPSLTVDSLNLCRRFFYAFDEDHRHSLSLPNVQRAISYAFLNETTEPSTSQVEYLFQKVIKERLLIGGEKARDDDQINLFEFVRLLFSLRAQTLKTSTNSSSG